VLIPIQWTSRFVPPVQKKHENWGFTLKNPYRCTRTAQTLIENLLEGLKQFGLTEKLVDFPKLLVQFIQRGINKAVAKTELLSYGCTHALFVTHAVDMTEK